MKANEDQKLQLMDKLKQNSMSFHEQLEGSNFQSDLFGGKLPLPSYVNYLKQLHCIHHCLESLVSQYKNNPQINEVVEDWQFQVPFLESDLTYLKVSTSNIAPSPATKHFTDAITSAAQKEPLSLLGFWYVLLGSKHGGMMLANSISTAYGFADGNGTAYMKPYGTGFMPLWQQFKANMNKLELSAAQEASLTQAANLTFSEMGEVGEAILQSQPTK